MTAKGYKCAFVLSDPVVLDVKFRDLHIPQGISPNNDGTMIRGDNRYRLLP